jgi:hypothetical protein
MFGARIVFFRLHESPRYLVHAGRPQEALESLQMISKFNGSELSLDLEDVRDHYDSSQSMSTRIQAHEVATTSLPHDSEVVFDADALGNPSPRTLTTQTSHEMLRGPSETRPSDYSSTGEPNVNLSDHTFLTPQIPFQQTSDSTVVATPAVPTVGEEEEDYLKAGRRPRHPRLTSSISRRSARRASTASIIETKSPKLYRMIPRFIRKPMAAWVDRVAMVLTPEWLRTTLLVWAAWCWMSLGKSISYNVCWILGEW